MKYPTRNDYALAVKYLDKFVFDETLNKGKPVTQSPNSPLLRSYNGGKAIVFQIEVGRKKYALKCWVEELGELKFRYQQIDNYLQEKNLPYFVDFSYKEKGILANGQKFPLVRMEWVNGISFKQFIANHIRNQAKIRRFADKFLEMVAKLHQYEISHGDLQHGNILIRDDGNDGNICLIDYDSLYVPQLSNETDQIKGLPGYQHPQREQLVKLSPKADYFSELVIYLSLLAIAEKPSYWQDIEQEEKLLFSSQDLRNPHSSKIFAELKQASSDEVRYLVNELELFCQEPDVEKLKPLEDIVNPYSDPSFVSTPISNQSPVSSISGYSDESNGSSSSPTTDSDPQGSTEEDIWTGTFGQSGVGSPWDEKFGSQVDKADDIEISSPYASGLDRYERGDLEGAIADFTEAIRLDPKNIDAYCYRGNAFRKQGVLEKAITDFSTAIKLNPNNSYKSYNNRGNLRLKKGNLSGAIADYTDAIYIKADYADAYYNRGLAYKKEGDLESAIADYTDAIYIKADYANAYYNRGLAYKKEGDLESAIADWQEATSLYQQQGNQFCYEETKKDLVLLKIKNIFSKNSSHSLSTSPIPLQNALFFLKENKTIIIACLLIALLGFIMDVIQSSHEEKPENGSNTTSLNSNDASNGINPSLKNNEEEDARDYRQRGDNPDNPDSENIFHQESFPTASCGDTLPTDPRDFPINFYPVFTGYNEDKLKNVQANYCQDAYRTIRKSTGEETIQIASFASQKRAEQFRAFISQRVGSSENSGDLS